MLGLKLNYVSKRDPCMDYTLWYCKTATVLKSVVNWSLSGSLLFGSMLVWFKLCYKNIWLHAGTKYVPEFSPCNLHADFVRSVLWANPWIEGSTLDHLVVSRVFWFDLYTLCFCCHLILQISGRLLTRDYKAIGIDINTADEDLDSDAFNPVYNFVREIRQPNIPPTTTLVLKVTIYLQICSRK